MQYRGHNVSHNLESLQTASQRPSTTQAHLRVPPAIRRLSVARDPRSAFRLKTVITRKLSAYPALSSLELEPRPLALHHRQRKRRGDR